MNAVIRNQSPKDNCHEASHHPIIMDSTFQSKAIQVDEILINQEKPDGGVIVKAMICRPDKLNALNHEVVSALKNMCKWAEEEDSVRIVIISGAPPNPPSEGKRAKPHAFVAGADISEFVDKNSEAVRQMFLNNAIEAIWNLSKPTIAMIDGYALGGGCELACSCDLRIGSKRALFGTPEINLGLIPGYGGTQRLPRLVGYGHAMEMILGGEMIDAERALSIGLLNHLFEADHLEQKTIEIAKNIGSKSPHTLKVAKNTVRAALEMPISKGIEIEAAAFSNLFDTNDQKIGVTAFLERTKPEWTGS